VNLPGFSFCGNTRKSRAFNSSIKVLILDINVASVVQAGHKAGQGRTQYIIN
jgi:hypothetical protein